MVETMRNCVYVLLLFLLFVSQAKAQELLALVPVADDVHGRKSQYILAASFSRQGQFDKAHDCFSQIIKAKVRSIAERSLKDLAILGRARLYYQQDKMREAALAYQQLGLDSVYAALMLYELGMTYIHYGDSLYAEPMRAQRIYQSGAKTLKQLFNLDKKVMQDPRVRLMAVDLLVRLEDDQKAALLYGNLVAALLSMQANLFEAAQRPDEFAAMLLAKQDDAFFEKSFAWVYSQEQVQNALKQLRENLQAQEKIKLVRVRYAEFLQKLLQNGEALTIAMSVQQQMSALNGLFDRLKKLEMQQRSLFAKTVNEAVPLWQEQSTWLLAGADSGLVRSILRGQRQLDENIRQIEMIKAKELSKIKNQFEVSHGGVL